MERWEPGLKVAPPRFKTDQLSEVAPAIISWKGLDHGGCVEGLNGPSRHGRATAALAREKITD